jgi:gliding motility associated protien GldN
MRIKVQLSVVISILLVLVSIIRVNAQVRVVENAFIKTTTKERKPAPLPAVRESDVVWSRTVWRLIDLREKANQQFYFPSREIQGRKNLINILLKAIELKSITAFDASSLDEEFKQTVTFSQVKKEFGDTTRVIKVTDINTGLERDSVIKETIRTQDVKQLQIKEIWYFDKQKSTLQVRILGICPIKVYRMDPKNPEISYKRLFWVNYPEIRPLLAKEESLNGFNGSRNLSFDDLFLTRRFDGYIVKEENLYNNRQIRDYADGEYAAQESERIKSSIFNYEQDLWEY